jgi:tetratricopeptide (TPR) repeat protein
VTDQPQQALACFTEAEAVLRHAQDHWHLAMLYTNQGLACRMLSEWAQAKAYFETALALWTRLGSIASQVNALDELACTYLEQGDAPAALAVLQQAFVRLQQMQQDPAYETHRANLTLHRQATLQAVERLNASTHGRSASDRPCASNA